MIEFIEKVQEWFGDPAELRMPQPLGITQTPVSELPKGEQGLAIRNAELFVSAYTDAYNSFCGDSESMFQWLIGQNLESLIQGLIEHRSPQNKPTAMTIKGTDIVSRCDISKSTLKGWRDNKNFPNPIEGIRPQVYDLSAVNEWLARHGRPTI